MTWAATGLQVGASVEVGPGDGDADGDPDGDPDAGDPDGSTVGLPVGEVGDTVGRVVLGDPDGLGVVGDADTKAPRTHVRALHPAPTRSPQHPPPFIPLSVGMHACVQSTHDVSRRIDQHLVNYRDLYTIMSHIMDSEPGRE